MSYNGWTNRETWVVNLHFGEYLQGQTDELLTMDPDRDISDIADDLEEAIDEIIDEEYNNLSLFLRDMLDMTVIDWFDLAETYRTDSDVIEDKKYDVPNDRADDITRILE